MGISYSKGKPTNAYKSYWQSMGLKPEVYIPKPDKSDDLMPSNNVLLLHGYIRSIERLLINTLIPTEIYKLCDDFYCSRIILIYLISQKYPSNFCIADIYDSSKKYNCINYEIDVYNKRPNTFFKKETCTSLMPIIEDQSICYTKNIPLPSSIRCKLSSNDSNINNEYNVIFRCGGSLNNNRQSIKDCDAFIWNSKIFKYADNALHHKEHNINVYHLRLPDFLCNVYRKGIVYSKRHSSLYVLADKLYKLSFKDDDITTIQAMRWQAMGIEHVLPDSYSTSCILETNDNNNKDKIIIFQNYPSTKPIIIYDIESEKWNVLPVELTNASRSRYGNGMCSDTLSQTVYIGGGRNAEQSVECIDIYKQKCYNDHIPNTLMKHNHYPSLWTQDGNLLYIASIKSTGIEWIDLRMNSKSWNIVTNCLGKCFQTEIVQYNSYKSRLLQ